MAKLLRTTMLVLVLATSLSVAVQLRCNKCDDCENEPPNYRTCPEEETACTKTIIDGKIKKDCGQESECGDGGDSFVHCCSEENFCNGSSDKRPSVGLGLLFILPFVTYIFGF